MAYSKVVGSTVLLFVILCFVSIEANPLLRILQRQKRVSDQRLAELETIIALSNMKGKLVTVPVGFGRIDPKKLGRRRRSVEKLLRTLMNDNNLSSSSESELDNTAEDLAEEERQQQQEETSNEQNLLLNLLYEELPIKYRTLPAE